MASEPIVSAARRLSAGPAITRRGSHYRAERSDDRPDRRRQLGQRRLRRRAVDLGQQIEPQQHGPRSDLHDRRGQRGRPSRLSPTDTIQTEASAATPEQVSVDNNTSGTITRTDGGSWIAKGFASARLITIAGSTANATGPGSPTRSRRSRPARSPWRPRIRSSPKGPRAGRKRSRCNTTRPIPRTP